MVPTKYRDIFARFKTMRRKQNLASALGIQKENYHAFFRDKKASILNKTPYISLYFTVLRIIVA